MKSKQAKMAVAPAFWNVRQVAAYLGCSTGAIWLWEREGTLRSYRKVGSRVVRFKREDVDRLIGADRASQ
jgi:excisionase family DNA binding protein